MPVGKWREEKHLRELCRQIDRRSLEGPSFRLLVEPGSLKVDGLLVFLPGPNVYLEYIRPACALFCLCAEDGTRLEDRWFHEIGVLEDGTLAGKFGAVVYILDREGKICSPGFHEIYPVGNGEYVGKIGAALFLGVLSCGAPWRCFSDHSKELRYPPEEKPPEERDNVEEV